MNTNLHAQLVDACEPTSEAKKVAFTHRPEGKLRGTGVRVNQFVSPLESAIQARNRAAAVRPPPGELRQASTPPKPTSSYRDALKKKYEKPPAAPPLPPRVTQVRRSTWPKISDTAIRHGLELHARWRGEHTFDLQHVTLPTSLDPDSQKATGLSYAVLAHIQFMKKWLFVEKFRFCNGREEDIHFILEYTLDVGNRSPWASSTGAVRYKLIVVSKGSMKGRRVYKQVREHQVIHLAGGMKADALDQPKSLVKIMAHANHVDNAFTSIYFPHCDGEERNALGLLFADTANQPSPPRLPTDAERWWVYWCKLAARDGVKVAFPESYNQPFVVNDVTANSTLPRTYSLGNSQVPLLYGQPSSL